MVRWTRCSRPTAILEKGSQAIGSLPGVGSLIRRQRTLVHALGDAGMIMEVEHRSVGMHDLPQLSAPTFAFRAGDVRNASWLDHDLVMLAQGRSSSAINVRAFHWHHRR